MKAQKQPTPENLRNKQPSIPKIVETKPETEAKNEENMSETKETHININSDENTNKTAVDESKLIKDLALVVMCKNEEKKDPSNF